MAFDKRVEPLFMMSCVQQRALMEPFLSLYKGLVWLISTDAHWLVV